MKLNSLFIVFSDKVFYNVIYKMHELGSCAAVRGNTPQSLPVFDFMI